MDEQVKLLACSLVQHVLGFEAEDFDRQLREGGIHPAEGVDSQEWLHRRDHFLEMGQEKDFDWLAFHSTGHVYCDAMQLNTYLGCCDD